jgi:DNA-binding IclR family transcriptional regulator
VRFRAARRAAPGSTTAGVAAATGIPTNTAAATISRLVKQRRVRRLDEDGYAPVDAAQIGAAAAPTDAAASGDTPGSATPTATGSETPR